MKKLHLIAFLLFSVIYLVLFLWIAFNGPLGNGGMAFVAVYIMLFVSMMGLWKFWPFGQKSAYVITVTSVILHAVMMAFPANNDVYRYIWEGYIQHHGFNPLEFAPDSETLSSLRNTLWEKMNHKDAPSIYYPFCQVIFWGITGFSTDPLAFKIIFSLFSMGTIFIILKVLKRLSLEEKHSILFAFNPLVLIFTAGEVHLIIVPVFITSLMIYCFYAEKPALLYFFCGLGAMTQITSAMLFPFIINKKDFKYLPLFFIPILAVIPYIGGVLSMISMPFRFATKFHFNGLLHTFISFFVSPDIASLLCWMAFITALAVVFFIKADTVRKWFYLFCAFIICTSTFQPWYLMIILPFIVLYRSPPWIALNATIAFSFLTFGQFNETNVWKQELWQLALEYIPFIFVSAYIIIISKRKPENGKYENNNS